MKTIYVVTGAAGFLGGTICRKLIEEGNEVRAFVIPKDPAMKYVPAEAEVICGDLCDKTAVHMLLDVPSDVNVVVMHIASIVTVNPDFSQKVMDVNVGGTANIIEECLKIKERVKLVYCSSTGAIPENDNDLPIREVDRFDETKVVGCYSQSKALATQLVLDAVRDYDLDACVIHPSGIMGPEDFSISETTRTLIKIIKGDMSMGIDGTFNLCDVRDLAVGAILAAKKGRKGECYILGNDAVSFRDFSRLVSDESGCRRMKIFLPIGIANILAKAMEKKAKKSGEKPLMTEFSVYNLARNNVFDSGKARRELGYKTRPYRDTIRDEIKWLKSCGYIA